MTTPAHDHRTLTHDATRGLVDALLARPRPRVLLTPARARLLAGCAGGGGGRAKTMAAYAAVARDIIPLPVLQREMEGRRLLAVSREALRRLFHLAMAWRLTGDDAFAQRAARELDAVCAFTDWNPAHYLDTAEMALGVAIACDWLHDVLPQTTRRAARAALREKCLDTARPVTAWWVTATNNWNQVCHAGVTAAALATAGDDPDGAAFHIHRAATNIHHAMQSYAPDGVYPEGPMYWHYGTAFNALFLELCFCAFGTDFGLGAMPGFLSSVQFMRHATGPSGYMHNFADAVPMRCPVCAVFPWMEERYGLALPPGAPEHRLLNGDTSLIAPANRIGPFLLLAGLEAKPLPPPPPPPPDWAGRGRIPVVYHRSAFAPGAWWVGIKGGTPSASHGHMDAGSFVFEAGGVRWAEDAGAEPYHPIEALGLGLWQNKQDGDRWNLFRLGQASHNIPLINNARQRVDQSALLVSSTTDGSPETVLDLTTLYPGLATRVSRRFLFENRSRLVIEDTFEGLPANARVRWQMLTPATVATPGPCHGGIVDFTLEKDGVLLCGNAHAPATLRLSSCPAAGLMQPYEKELPGRSMLYLDAVVDGGGSFKTTVAFELQPRQAAQKKSADA